MATFIPIEGSIPLPQEDNLRTQTTLQPIAYRIMPSGPCHGTATVAKFQYPCKCDRGKFTTPVSVDSKCELCEHLLSEHVDFSDDRSLVDHSGSLASSINNVA
jgi:hypothetical protein